MNRSKILELPGVVNTEYKRQVTSPRTRIIARMCPSYAERILDSGCGRGDTLKKLNLQKCKLRIGVDVSDAALSIAKGSKAELIKADAGTFPGRLPFRENTFDLILSVEMLPFFKEDSRVMSEYAKLLKKNGYMIICAAYNSKLWNNEDLLVGHYRRYDDKDLEKLIKTAGLEVVDVRYSGFPFYLFSRRLINKTVKKRTDAHFTGNVGQGLAARSRLFKLILELAISIELLFQRLPLGTFIIVKAKK